MLGGSPIRLEMADDSAVGLAMAQIFLTTHFLQVDGEWFEK